MDGVRSIRREAPRRVTVLRVEVEGWHKAGDAVHSLFAIGWVPLATSPSEGFTILAVEEVPSGGD